MLEDTARFLIEISEESVGNDLRDDFNPIAVKWKQLFDVCDLSIFYLILFSLCIFFILFILQNVNKYMDAGVIVQNRKKYFYLLEELQKWIVKAENIMSAPQTNTNEDVLNHCRQLQVSKP